MKFDVIGKLKPIVIARECDMDVSKVSVYLNLHGPG
jgi:hypothetical protein